MSAELYRMLATEFGGEYRIEKKRVTTKKARTGAPGRLSLLSIQLFISAQVLIYLEVVSFRPHAGLHPGHGAYF